MEQSVQERYAPNNACFGCGPANAKGLRIRSFPAATRGEGAAAYVATFKPDEHHEAFTGMLNGGIIGALLDCHCNWTAAMHFMAARGVDVPPCTVTAAYEIRLKRPTPTDGEVHLRATVVESTESKAVVEGTLVAGDKVCATCRGTFVAVEEGHPAYHRW